MFIVRVCTAVRCFDEIKSIHRFISYTVMAIRISHRLILSRD